MLFSNTNEGYTMLNYIDLAIASFIALISTFLLTFGVRKFAIRFKFVDFPNQRKIHKYVTPRIGGLGIFLGAALGLWYLQPEHINLTSISLGAMVIVITGLLDDRLNIRPVIKLTGQIIAASFLVSSGLIIERITLPFIGMIDLGAFSVLITFIWVVGITNAINLIDGLDGLASGVSTIALLSMFVMASIQFQLFAACFRSVRIATNLALSCHTMCRGTICVGADGWTFVSSILAVISLRALLATRAVLSLMISLIILAGAPCYA